MAVDSSVTLRVGDRVIFATAGTEREKAASLRVRAVREEPGGVAVHLMREGLLDPGAARNYLMVIEPLPRGPQVTDTTATEMPR